jgi:PAB-dependent poly(A)-specific ribonuclease subunit 3
VCLLAAAVLSWLLHTQLDALTREMENGRLFRLVSKLAFVTDRNSSDVCAASGDTGNSYLLQLFRDFVFHQGERDGGRVIDWGHIVENLNKVGGCEVGCGSCQTVQGQNLCAR